MIALDTNMLARYLLADEPGQARATGCGLALSIIHTGEILQQAGMRKK